MMTLNATQIAALRTAFAAHDLADDADMTDARIVVMATGFRAAIAAAPKTGETKSSIVDVANIIRCSDIDTFKGCLLAMHRANAGIDLSRADLITPAMHDVIVASEIQYVLGGRVAATFHYARAV